MGQKDFETLTISRLLSFRDWQLVHVRRLFGPQAYGAHLEVLADNIGVTRVGDNHQTTTLFPNLHGALEWMDALDSGLRDELGRKPEEVARACVAISPAVGRVISSSPLFDDLSLGDSGKQARDFHSPLMVDNEIAFHTVSFGLLLNSFDPPAEEVTVVRHRFSLESLRTVESLKVL